MDGGFITDKVEHENKTYSYHETASHTISNDRDSEPKGGLTQEGRATLLGHSSGCQKCPSLSFCDDLYKTFGIFLCNTCRKNEKLISKSTGKQKYLLSDNDLRNAPCLKRANPHRKDWQPMKLYLESHLQGIAFEKYGGQEGLEKEARGRVSRKLEARLKEKETQVYQEARRSKRLKEIRESIEESREDCIPEIDVHEEDI
eukprot:jgi/Picsp_1/6195/NSC_03549-R1_xeroderma pigmentosum group a